MAWPLIIYLAGVPIAAIVNYVAFERAFRSNDVVDEILSGVGALFGGLVWPLLALGYAVAIIGKTVNQHLRTQGGDR